MKKSETLGLNDSYTASTSNVANLRETYSQLLKKRDAINDKTTTMEQKSARITEFFNKEEATYLALEREEKALVDSSDESIHSRVSIGE